MHYIGLFDIENAIFHHFRIGEEIYIKGNNVALITQFELCSTRCANLSIDVRSSSANVGIPLETNILLALYGLQIPRRRRSTPL